ncbi:MAG: alkaline phosphatase family protein [Opitutales bacterium]
MSRLDVSPMAKRKLILVGWDGADWHIARPLLEAGQMPQLKQLIDYGASGDLRSHPPYLSPMLWNTIATGKNPAEHGIIGFTEFSPETGKIRPMSSRSRKVKAVWNILSQSGLRAHVLGWFASHPAEQVNGVCLAETFGKFKPGEPADKVTPGCVFPADRLDDLVDCRVRPGDLDVNILRFFIPRIEEIDLRRDKRPDKLLERLSELYTYHNAAVRLLQEDQTDFLAVYFHFIDWVCHDFMHLGPPKRPEVIQRDFEIYGGVVEAAYRLQDLLLADLLKASGPGTTAMVISDHGFLSGTDRPAQTPGVTAGIAAWHRPEGVIAMAGPGIRRGQIIHGARLIDITPTLLHLYGLPVGNDLDGRVLTGALEEPGRVRQMASWEKQGPSIDSLRGEDLTDQDQAALLQQFEDLGYISQGNDPLDSPEAMTLRENAWNLGQALLQAGRWADALPHLEEAFFHNPLPHVALPLARCQARLGLIEESRESEAVILDRGEDNAEARFLLAELSRERGDYVQALGRLDQAVAAGGNALRANKERGLIYLLQERWTDAEALFYALFEEQPAIDLQLGWVRALVRGGKAEQAEPEARTLTELAPGLPNAWFSLGQALLALDRAGEARDAFARAAAIDPDFRNAAFALTRAERQALKEQGIVQPVFFDEMDFTQPGKTGPSQDQIVAERRKAAARRQQERVATRARKREQEEPVTVIHGRDAGPDNPDQPPIIIVSGLPRSGTSMMMQFLHAGGLPVQTDGKREADADNPRGYYEWEAIKTLGQHPEIIDEAAGKAVKVVSLLLQSLPPKRTYKIIWMDRPVEEIADSQARMVDRAGKSASATQKQLDAHREAILSSLKNQKAIDWIRIDYRKSLEDPEALFDQMKTFLDHAAFADFTDRAAAVATVDPSLHRSRSHHS